MIMNGNICEILALFLFRVQSKFVGMSGAGFYGNL
jgi:hypothetical protein